MISLELEQEGYEGIPAIADALTEDDVKQWAETKDASLIPYAIAMLKALCDWGESTGEDTTGDNTTGGETTGGEDTTEPDPTEQGGAD